MVRPDLTVYQDLPVFGVPSPKRLGQLEATLRNLELGYFRDAALLWNAMMRDARINGVMTARVNSLVGAPMEFTPADGRRGAKSTARTKSIAGDAEDTWPTMFPPDQVAQLLSWGIGLGIGLGELVWDRGDDAWAPRLRIWHPQFIRWDWDTRAYWLQLADGRELQIEPGNGKWVVYTPYGYEYAWLNGLVRPLAPLWLSRTWAQRDWSNYSEVHGKPIKLASVPTTADKADKTSFVNRVAAMEANTTVKLERDDEGKGGFDLKLLEAMANNHEGFEKLLNYVDVAVAICINGQNMSTDGMGGLGAQEKAGEPVRADVKRKDALVADVLREQALTWWALFNYGDRNLAPWPAYQTEPPDDGQAVALELKTLAEACSTFKLAGAPLDVRALLEQRGVPMLAEAEVEDATKATHPGFLPGQEQDPNANANALPPNGDAAQPQLGSAAP